VHAPGETDEFRRVTDPEAEAGYDASPITMLLLHQSRLFAEILRRRLLTETDVANIGIVTSVADALHALGDERYSVIVATATLARELRTAPRGRGLAVTTPTVVLADAEDRRHARELFRLGVTGWVGRDRSSSDLMDAVRTCRRGDSFVPADILAVVVQQHTASEGHSSRERTLALLTDREMQIFLLLEQGLGRNDIAVALHLSPNTVRTHIHRILRRLDVHSTLAALAAARD